MIAIIDFRAKTEIIENLAGKGFTVIKTEKNLFVDERISGHGDISIFKINNRKIIVAPESYIYYKEQLEGYGIDIIKGEKKSEKKYPENIKYNAFKFKEYIFHKIKCTDNSIIEYAKVNNINLVDVAQGYSKCATLVIKDKGIITEDKGIYEAVKNKGINALIIKAGYISLEGYDYGFIGGSSGFYEGKVFFTGKLEFHKDKDCIEGFIKSLGCEIIYLSNELIYDYGTIFFLDKGEKNE